MERQINKLDFTGQNIYVGIDTHKKDWKVTIVLDHVSHKTFCLHPPSVEKLQKYLQKNFPNGNYYSAYEAGFCGYWIHEHLEKAGIKNLVVNAADIPVTNKEKVQKEDKRDSRKIARSLRNGEINGIYVPIKKLQEDRSLLRYRFNVSKELTRNKNRIKMMLYFYGIEIPEEFSGKNNRWTKRFIEFVESIELQHETGTYVLLSLLEDCRYYKDKLRLVNKKIRELGNSPEYCEMLKLLKTIPGISTLSVMVILTELYSMKRFKRLDDLCSYVGFVPRTNSSSEREIANKITPRCHSLLRNIIVECAWVAVRYDPAMVMAFNKLCERMKPHKAIIRISKKLLNRIRYVMKNQQPYVANVVK